MSSTLQDILDALQSQIMDNTSIAVCNTAWRFGETNFPHAELIVFSGTTNDDVSSVIDTELGFMVRVRSHGKEGVQVALEEIMVLWKGSSNTLCAALNALGVINIQPVIISPPVVFAGTPQQPAIGDLQFLMTVRYSYT